MREIIHTCPKRIHYDKFLFFMLKGRRLQVSGFTLVELIVVITILAILGTIAFISLQGYSANSRDSVRSSDMGAIKVSLELYQLASGNYPNTTGGNIITFSGSEAWKQGTFGNDTFKNIDKMDDIPVDPLTGREYTYSVTNRKNEYQLAGIMEGDEYVYNNPLIPLPREIVSAAGNKTALLKVIGNYNGQMLRVVQGNTTYILAVPSIITSTGGTLTDIITNGYLAFNGYKNLPLDYKGSTYNELGEGTMDLVKVADLVVYSGSIDEIQSQDGVGRKIMLTNLQKAYSGTLLENNEGIKILTNINSLTDKKREELGCILSNNNLGAKLFIKDCKKTISGNFFIKGLQTNSSGESYGDTISYDSSGNIYITGLFKGNITIGTDTYTSLGNYDIFLAKFDSGGNYIWSKKAGGSGKDTPYITVIKGGFIYIIGKFSSGSPNIFGDLFTNIGNYDMFITKFDLDGNVIINKMGGGVGDDRPKGMTVADNGYVYITGQYEGTSDIFGINTTSPDVNSDSFIAKLDTTLNSIWVKNGNSIGSDWGNTIEIDNTTGDLYVGGTFGSNMNLYGTGITTYGSSDSYLLKMNNSGILQWIRTAGGVGYEETENLILDNSGNIYFTGYFRGTSATLFGEIISSPTNGSRNDTYVSKLSIDGTLLWNSIGKGSGNDYGQSIALDNNGGLYSVGSVGIGDNSLFGQSITSNIDGVTYISKLNISTGNAEWSKLYGNNKIRDNYADIKFDGTNLLLLGAYESNINILGQNFISISNTNELFFGKIKSDGTIN